MVTLTAKDRDLIEAALVHYEFKCREALRIKPEERATLLSLIKRSEVLRTYLALEGA